jgi:hypothetical protein
MLLVKSASRVEQVLCHGVGHFIAIKVHRGSTAWDARFLLWTWTLIDGGGSVERFARGRFDHEGLIHDEGSIDCTEPVDKRGPREATEHSGATKGHQDHELSSLRH